MQDIDSDHKDQEETVSVHVSVADPDVRAQRRALRAAAAAEASYLMSVRAR